MYNCLDSVWNIIYLQGRTFHIYHYKDETSPLFLIISNWRTTCPALEEELEEERLTLN